MASTPWGFTPTTAAATYTANVAPSGFTLTDLQAAAKRLMDNEKTIQNKVFEDFLCSQGVPIYYAWVLFLPERERARFIDPPDYIRFSVLIEDPILARRDALL